MADFDEDQLALTKELAPNVNHMRFITLGLIASPVLFALFAFYVPIFEVQAKAAQVLMSIALVIGLIVLAVHRPTSRYLANLSCKNIDLERADSDPSSLGGALLSASFVTVCLCCGGSFISLIAFWVTRNQMGLLMGVMLVASAVTQVPKLEATVAWVQHQLDRLRNDEATRDA